MDLANTERVERTYLMSLLVRNTLPDYVRVDVDDMQSAAYRDILSSIYDCEEAYGLWDLYTVANYMHQKRSPHVDVIENIAIDMEVLGDSAPRAEQVKQLAVERRYHEAAQKIVAANKDGRYLDALEVAESMSEIKPLKKDGFESLDLVDVVAAARAEMRENIRGAGGRLRFGVPVLDTSIGGLSRGSLAIIGGTTTGGKSSLSLYLAVKMAQSGKRVGILSLEDPKTLWGDRTMGLLADVRISWLLGGVNLGVEALAELSEQGNTAELMARDLAIRLTLCTGARVAEAVSEARKLVKNYQPDVLIVDYIQAARFDLRTGRYDKLVTDFAQSLKGLCVQNNLVLILTSQLHRLQRGEEPYLNSLKESGDLENLSEVVMLLWHKEVGGGSRNLGKIAKVKWAVPGLRFELVRDPSHGMIAELLNVRGENV